MDLMTIRKMKYGHAHIDFDAYKQIAKKVFWESKISREHHDIIES